MGLKGLSGVFRARDKFFGNFTDGKQRHFNHSRVSSPQILNQDQ
jgi:hypothetical protein